MKRDLQSACLGLGLNLSDAQLDRFEDFESNLYEANRIANLTRVPRNEAWLRHFVDSLLIQDLILPGLRVLDIGSGPGLPAWPIACARPDIRVTALDSNGKMVGFLRANLLPNLEVVQARAEEWDVRERFDVVTGRAVAPLPVFLELAAARAKKGGLVLPMRTPADLPLILRCDPTHLGLKLDQTLERDLGDAKRVFPIYRKLRRTPAEFPRPWAQIKRS